MTKRDDLLLMDQYYQERMVKDHIETRLIQLLNQYEHLRKYDREGTINMSPVDAAIEWIERDKDAAKARLLMNQAMLLIEEALQQFPNAQPTDHNGHPRIDVTDRFFLDYLEAGLFYLSTPLEAASNRNGEWLESIRDLWYSTEDKFRDTLISLMSCE